MFLLFTFLTLSLIKTVKGRQEMGRRGGMTQARFKLASLERATCHLIVLQFTFVAVNQ